MVQLSTVGGHLSLCTLIQIPAGVRGFVFHILSHGATPLGPVLIVRVWVVDSGNLARIFTNPVGPSWDGLSRWTLPSPNVSWDRLQHPVTLKKDKECLGYGMVGPSRQILMARTSSFLRCFHQVIEWQDGWNFMISKGYVAQLLPPLSLQRNICATTLSKCSAFPFDLDVMKANSFWGMFGCIWLQHYLIFNVLRDEKWQSCHIDTFWPPVTAPSPPAPIPWAGDRHCAFILTFTCFCGWNIPLYILL